MNMGVRFTVTKLDESTSSHKVRPFSQVAFEREHGSMIAALEAKELSKIYWLAWHAATGGSVSLDDWLREVDEIAFDFGDPASPTSPARPGI